MMFAFRTTWNIQPGKMFEARKHLESGIQNVISGLQEDGYTKVGVWRIYTPILGPAELVFEHDFEQLADNDAFWAQMDMQSETAQRWQIKWNELVHHRGMTRVWNLIRIQEYHTSHYIPQSDEPSGAIAQRMVLHLNSGMSVKATEMLDTGMVRALHGLEADGHPINGEWRVYTLLFNPDVMFFELDLRTREERDVHFAQIGKHQQEEPDFWQEWYGIIDHFGNNDLWYLTKM